VGLCVRTNSTNNSLSHWKCGLGCRPAYQVPQWSRWGQAGRGRAMLQSVIGSRTSQIHVAMPVYPQNTMTALGHRKLLNNKIPAVAASGIIHCVDRLNGESKHSDLSSIRANPNKSRDTKLQGQLMYLWLLQRNLI